MILKVPFSCTVIALAALLATSCAWSQANPPEPMHHHHGPMPTPANLQILPKDTTPEQLMTVMHQFEGELGVHCSFCHEADPQTHHMDFASDAKPEKTTARIMMQMTASLNAKYLSQLPDHGTTEKVTCGTCHRGQSMPAVYTPAPEEHEHPPMPAGK